MFHQKTLPKPGIISAIAGSLTTGYKLKNRIIHLLEKHSLSDAMIYTYSYWCNDMATGLALLKLEFPDICCISRAHGYEVYLERSAYRYLPLRKFIFSTLDKVYFVSQHGYEYSRRLFGKHESFKVSYLGVHANTSSRNLNKNHLRVVSCSSIITLKNIDVIIDALSGYTSESIHWTHIGTGKEYGKIKSYAENQLGKSTNLTFEFKGHLDNSTLLKLYAEESFDLFLSTSLSEGLPFSMMEAMAYGIPVIGPDVGGVKEIVDHKTNGFLLKPNPQPSDLKLAIDEFLRFTPERRSQMANNAKLTWRSKFNAEKNYTAFVRDLLVF